jgi:hypothetical protein
MRHPVQFIMHEAVHGVFDIRLAVGNLQGDKAVDLDRDQGLGSGV